MILAAVLALLAGDPVVLREKAAVEGRFVRLLDLVESDGLEEAVRRALAPVFLGRAPGDGATRTIAVGEIRLELERRGLAPVEFRGASVEVARGPAENAAGSLRRALAFEIKRHLLETHAGLRPDEVAVRVACDGLEGIPADAEISDLQPRIGPVPGAGTFTATLVHDGSKRAVSGEARVLKSRDVLVAAREIAPGRILEHADLETRRIEVDGEETVLADAAAAVGSPAAARIRKGELLAPSALKMKPVVRKGDVVRAVTRDFEVDARALEDGAPGAEIALEYLGTRNRLRARVAGPGQVRVAEENR